MVAFILRKIFKTAPIVQGIAGTFSFVYLEAESFARPDSLYNVTVLFTIFLFLKSLDEKKSITRRWLLVLAAVFSVITVFIKQSGIYLPFLIIVYLAFFLPSWKDLIVAIGWMLISFITLLYTAKGTEIDIFLKNTIGGVNNGASYSWWVMRILELHLQRESVLDISGLFLGGWYLVKGRDHTYQFIGLRICITFLFDNVTGLKI